MFSETERKARGCKIIYAYPTHGHDGDKEMCNAYLKLNQEYTIHHMEISQSSSVIYLEEVIGIPFNSVMFKNVEGGKVECLGDPTTESKEYITSAGSGEERILTETEQLRMILVLCVLSEGETDAGRLRNLLDKIYEIIHGFEHCKCHASHADWRKKSIETYDALVKAGELR